MICRLKDIVRTLHTHARLPPTLQYLTYEMTKISTPHYALYFQNSTYDHIRVFGLHMSPITWLKTHIFHHQSIMCLFLSYSPDH